MQLVYWLYTAIVCLTKFELSNAYIIPQSEYVALWDFYNSTSGFQWLWRPLYAGIIWNFTNEFSDPCENHWQGIKCISEGNSTNVYNITLNSFRLNGTLPQSLDSFIKLESLELVSNPFLTGPIPSSIGNLSHIAFLNISKCMLTGLIPETVSSMVSLVRLDFSENKLDGTIPASLGDLFRLKFLLLHKNNFDGFIPTSLSSLSNLTVLALHFNQLTGTLTDSFSSLNNLQIFSVSNNDLWGSLPSFSGSANVMQNLDMSFNYFRGAIPNKYFSFTVIKFLYLGDNYLSGSLPAALGGMRSLKVFSAFKNLLEGRLTGVFNASTQSLIVLEVNDNQFSGEIPAEVFAMPLLKSLSLSKNCLRGSIPQSVCALDQLVALSMDGIMTASACQQSFFPVSWHLDTYKLASVLSGGIPSCLYGLPLIQSLHLSGNGLVGKLVQNDSVVLSSSLNDLCLSYNSLSGTIPLAMQRHNFLLLDLSHNRITGQLGESFATYSPNQTLSLQLNRISGDVPTTLLSARSIDVLEGNLFRCDLTESSLPTHDPIVDEYQCGSNSFNYAAYLWLIVLFVFIAFALYVRVYMRCQQMDSGGGVQEQQKVSNLRQAVENCSRWMSVFVRTDVPEGVLGSELMFIAAYNQKHRGVMVFAELVQVTRRSCLALTAIVLFVALPVYAALTPTYGIYYEEFAWEISAVYLTGFVPCILFGFVFALLAGTSRYYYQQKLKLRSRQDPVTTPSTHKAPTPWLFYGCLVGIVTLNMIVVMTVNIVYIYLYQSQGPYVVFAAQVLVAVFKVFWNSLAVPALLKWLFVVLHAVDVKKRIASIDFRKESNRPGVVLSLFHSSIPDDLLNAAGTDNHMSRSISTDSGNSIFTANSSSSSSSTFDQDSSGASSSVVSRMAIELFVVLFNNLAATFVASALFSPNCFYYVFVAPEEQAAASLICDAYEASRTGLRCSEFVVSDSSTFYTPPFTYNYECASLIITSYANIYVYMFLIITFADPLLMVLLKGAYDRATDRTGLYFRTVKVLLPKLLRPIDDLLESCHSAREEQVAVTTYRQALHLLFFPRTERDSLLDLYQFAVQVMQSVSILLTFGAVVPPLAVMGCVALWCKTYAYQLLVGRFVCLCLEEQRDKKKDTSRLLRILERDLSRLANILVGSEWIALPFIMVFYALLLFDTLGDELGWREALWLPVVVCGLPVAIACVVRVMRHVVPRKSVIGKVERETDVDEDEDEGL